jgi:hypothetical protein
MKLGIALVLIATPACALDLNDTMQQWKAAPVEVRAQIVKEAAASRGPVDRTRLLSCMNQVGDTRLLLPKLVSEMIDYCLKAQD